MPKTKTGKLLRAVRRYRKACDQCAYMATCTLAPVALQIDRENQERDQHPHAHKLQKYADGLRTKYPDDWAERLLAVLDEKDDATLLAGCILWQGLSDDDEDAVELLGRTCHAGLAPQQRGPLLRLACALGERAVDVVREHLEATASDDPEDALPYHAVAFFFDLASSGATAEEWELGCRQRDAYVYTRSFASRDIDTSSGSLDLFAETEEGGEVRLFYYRRDIHGHASLTPLTKIRVDSLLRQVFKVFAKPEAKASALFHDVCAFVELNAGIYERKLLVKGLASLNEDDVYLLASRSSVLAGIVEECAKVPGLERLIDVSHTCLREGEEKGRIDKVLFDRRKEVREAYAHTGELSFKKLCTAIFRLADASRKLPQAELLTPQLAEILYYMTALVGLNQQGILKALGGENPKAYLAFGLMPPVADPRENFKRMVAVLKEKNLKKRIRISVDQGLRHMAAQHGYDDPEEFAAALRGWEVREPDPDELVPVVETPVEVVEDDSEPVLENVELLDASDGQTDALEVSDEVLSDEELEVLEEPSEVDIASSDDRAVPPDLLGMSESFEEQFDSVADIDVFDVPWLDDPGGIQFEDAVDVPEESDDEDEDFDDFELPRPPGRKKPPSSSAPRERNPQDDTAFALEMIRLEDEEEARSESDPIIEPEPEPEPKPKSKRKKISTRSKKKSARKKTGKKFKAPKRRTRALDRAKRRKR